MRSVRDRLGRGGGRLRLRVLVQLEGDGRADRTADPRGEEKGHENGCELLAHGLNGGDSA